MDIDELLTKEDFKKLISYIKENPAWGYEFPVKFIYPDGLQYPTICEEVLNPRLFGI